ncbi:hypothetical protein INR49_005312 [Caranx melampygus]|nr:hypothetical protein INR49_005312 [Caranx melampygus]
MTSPPLPPPPSLSSRLSVQPCCCSCCCCDLRNFSLCSYVHAVNSFHSPHDVQSSRSFSRRRCLHSPRCEREHRSAVIDSISSLGHSGSVNFQVLIITMSVLAGIIIIAILICCFCCCKCERIGNKKEDAKVERQARARKARQKARRTEMQLRHDEIRQKYGLAKDNPYSRMDDH